MPDSAITNKPQLTTNLTDSAAVVRKEVPVGSSGVTRSDVAPGGVPSATRVPEALEHGASRTAGSSSNNRRTGVKKKAHSEGSTSAGSSATVAGLSTVVVVPTQGMLVQTKTTLYPVDLFHVVSKPLAPDSYYADAQAT